MPNYCANSLKLTATTPANRELLAKIRAHLGSDEVGIFQLIDPTPAELLDTRAGYPKDDREPNNIEKFGFSNWYEFRISRWGTKWDACEITLVTDKPDTLLIEFDTAWSPPVGIYETLHSMGFEVEATYCEQGCDFVGFWVNGANHTDELSKVVPAFYDDENGFSFDELEHYFTRHHIDHTPAHFGG